MWRGQTLIHQDTTGIPDALEAGDHFGTDLAIADTNADGYAELAIGVGDEDLGTSRPYGGLVTVVYGGSAGLNFGRVLLLHQDTAGLPDIAEEYDRFGSKLAFRDFNRDRRAELVISSPGEDGGDGVVHVLRAILSTGLTGNGSVMAGRGTLGLPRLAGIGGTLDG